MKNIQIEVKRRGCELLVAELSWDEDGIRVSKDVKFSGNANTSAYWGATLVVDALNEAGKDNPIAE